jgi:hypothetical protein
MVDWAVRFSVVSLAAATVSGDWCVLYSDSLAFNPKAKTETAKKKRAHLSAKGTAVLGRMGIRLLFNYS